MSTQTLCDTLQLVKHQTDRQTDWNSRHDWKACCHAEDAAALHQQLQPNTDATAVASEASGVLGTSFYISPEIANGWPQYDNKVDLYSLGVIAFELWDPFTTAMERVVVLRELVETGVMPPGWPEAHPVVRAICAATHTIISSIIYLTVWGVEPVVTHQTSWLESTGVCGVRQNQAGGSSV